MGQPIWDVFKSFNNMSKFRWGGLILFEGNMINAPDVTWYNILKWFGITTPVMILTLGIAGCVMALRPWLRRPTDYLQTDIGRNLALYFAAFAGSVGAVIILKSVLYDDAGGRCILSTHLLSCLPHLH